MSGKRELTTRGVVIGRRAASEGSARVFLYTEMLGLLSAIARSAREERSQLRPHVQWGTRGLYTLVLGRETWRVTGASETSNVFFELSERIAAKETAARVLETIRQFVHGEGANAGLFSALWGFSETLPKISDDLLPDAEHLAALRILSALGYIGTPAVAPFLGSAYEPEMLTRERSARVPLIRLINDGIAASGL